MMEPKTKTGNFILLDAARMIDAMEEAKQLNRMVEALFNARSETLLQAVGPFVFTFSEFPAFDDFFFKKGWGDHWGVILSAPVELKEVAAHFRRFLKVSTEDGVQLYFRFYDPRVLRIFLPTCDASQLRDFFGPVQYFLMEDEDSAFALKFWLQNGVLATRRIPTAELLAPQQAQTSLSAPQPAPPTKTKPRRSFSIFDDAEAPTTTTSKPGANTGTHDTDATAPTSTHPSDADSPAVRPTQPPRPGTPKKPKWDMFN